MLVDCIVWLLVTLVAILGARDDWYHLSIPNQHSLVLLLLFPLATLSPAHVTFIPGCIAGVLTLFLGLLLYAAKAMGGGDVKFATTLSLYVGLENWPRFMLGTMLAGGVLALIALYLRRHPDKIPVTVKPDSWLGRIQQDPLQTPLPYGLAIAFAAIAALGGRLMGSYFYDF